LGAANSAYLFIRIRYSRKVKSGGFLNGSQGGTEIRSSSLSKLSLRKKSKTLFYVVQKI